MPVYEYECSKCGNTEEVLQKISDKPLKKCNSCSGKLHKLISHSSFHLKGSGWYVTDYGNKTGKKIGDSDTKTVKTPPAEKKTKKADKKSANKSE